MSGIAIITIGQKQWQVYLAATFQEIIQGLGGISAVPPQTGMLFDLGYDQVITVTTIPMLFPLDIVFISSGLQVVDIARNVPPGALVASDNFARHFLEVNAGEAAGIQIGDEVHVQILAYPDPPIGIPPMPRDPMSLIFEFGMAGMMMLFAGNIAKSVIKDTLAPPKKDLPHERKLLPPGRLPKTEPKLTTTRTCIQCGKEFPAARHTQRNLCAKCLTPGLRSWVQEELPFAATGIGKLWWLATIRGKTYQVEARGIRGLTERQLEDVFADSAAKISVPYEERRLERELPFAAAEKGKLWWLATIEGKTHQVEVRGIRGLTERQLEDAFADSIALVSIPTGDTPSHLPQTKHRGSRLEQLEKEALDLQRKIRARWPAHVPEPWPEELKKLQGRLWKLGYEIIKEERRLKHLPEVKHFPQVDREKPSGWFRWPGKDEPEDREEKLEDKWFRRGVEAGKTDGWMTVEDTLAETLERHGHRGIDDFNLVWWDIEEWETTDHFHIFYGSKMMDDAGRDLDLYSELKAEFWEGYLTGRKEIGIDIYKIAAELVKSPPLPERERIATISLRGDMYVGEIKDQFGLVESVTVARTVEEVRKWAKEHGATDLRIRESGKHPQTIPNPTIDYDEERKQLRRDLREGAISEEAYKKAIKDLMARKHKPRPTRYDVTVESWMERDRLGIWITDNRTDETIAEWWDEDARELFEQGFFKPGVPERALEKPGREFIDSVLDYAEAAGLLARDNPRGGKESEAKVIPLHPPPRGQTGLEFLADGPQHLAQTIDAIGYRTQIDDTFQKAIARAKGTLTPRG